jgi:hypothetical protein
LQENSVLKWSHAKGTPEHPAGFQVQPCMKHSELESIKPQLYGKPVQLDE